MLGISTTGKGAVCSGCSAASLVPGLTPASVVLRSFGFSVTLLLAGGGNSVDAGTKPDSSLLLLATAGGENSVDAGTKPDSSLLLLATAGAFGMSVGCLRGLRRLGG